MSVNEVSTGITELTSYSDLNGLYDVIKNRMRELDRAAARSFSLGQYVEFYEKGSFFKGNVSNIGRTGRIKIDLIDNRYDNFTGGAKFLSENLK